MRGKRAFFLLVLGASLPGGSCNSTTSPSETIEPIQIDSITVIAPPGAAGQVSAHVRGVIGDGCAELLPVQQMRSGNRIDIAILRRRPVDAVCIQIAKLYDETLALPGDFPPGEYLLQVNRARVSFSIPLKSS